MPKAITYIQTIEFYNMSLPIMCFGPGQVAIKQDLTKEIIP